MSIEQYEQRIDDIENQVREHEEISDDQREWFFDQIDNLRNRIEEENYSEIEQLEQEIEELENEVYELIEHSQYDLNDFASEVESRITGEQTREELERLGEEMETLSLTEATERIMQNSDEPLENQRDEDVNAFDMFVGWELIWSFFKSLIEKHKDEDTLLVDEDELIVDLNRDENDISSVEALSSAEWDFNTYQREVVGFLNSDSRFAREYKERKYYEVYQVMREYIPEFVAQYNEAIENEEDLEWEEQNLWDQMKDVWVGWVFDGENWDENTWATAANAWAMAVGALAVGRTVSGFFSGSNNSWNNSWNDSSGGWFSWVMWSVAKWWAVWWGAYLLWRWWRDDEGDAERSADRWSDYWERFEDEHVRDFESLESGRRSAYNNFASGIDRFYSSIYWVEWWISDQNDMMWQYQFEEEKDDFEYAGVYAYALDRRYSSINDILSDSAFYTEIVNASREEFIESIRNWWYDKLKPILEPFAGLIDGLTPDIFSSSDYFQERIEQLLETDDNVFEQIREIFRKNVKVISFLQNRSTALQYKIAKNALEENEPGFQDKTDEEKQITITEKLEDEDFFEQYISEDLERFMNKNIYEATEMLDEYDLLDWEVMSYTSEEIDQIDDRYEDLLGIDENWQSMIDDIIVDFESWDDLESAEREYLNEIVETLSDDIEGFGDRGWVQALLWPYAHMFDLESSTRREILENTGYEDMVWPWRDVLEEFEDPSNVTREDIENLRQTAEDFKIFKKEITVWTESVTELNEEDWNLIIKSKFTARQFWQEISSAIGLIFEGEFKDWFFELSAWTWITVSMLWGFLLNRTRIPNVFKLPNATITAPVRIPANMLVDPTLRRAPAMVSHMALYKWWSWAWNLWYDLSRWRISLEKAHTIFNRMNSDWIFRSPQQTNTRNLSRFFDKIDSNFSHISSSEERMRIFNNYLENSNFRKSLYKKPWRFNLSWYNPEFDERLFHELWRIDELIQSTSWNENAFLRNFVRYYNWNIDNLGNIVNNIWNIDWIDDLSSRQINQLSRSLARHSKSLDPSQINRLASNIIWEINEWNQINISTYVRNSSRYLRSWTSFDSLNDIPFEKLNTSRPVRYAREWISEARNILKSNKDNPRIPQRIRSGMNTTIDNLTNLKNNINESTARVMNSENLRHFRWIEVSNSWEFTRLFQELQWNRQLRRSLAQASNVEDVRELLRSVDWLNVDNLDNSVLRRIANSGNQRYISDIVDYAQNYDNMTRLQRVMQNPTMRWVGRTIWRALIVTEYAFAWFEYWIGMEEAERVREHNEERADWIEQRTKWASWAALWTAIVSTLYWVSAKAMSVPGYWWALGWALAIWTAAYEWVHAYHDYREMYKKNLDDFKRKTDTQTKQALVSIVSWAEDIEWSLGSFLADALDTFSFGDIKEDIEEYIEEGNPIQAGMKSLIFSEEIYNFPWARLDIDLDSREGSELNDEEANDIRSERRELYDRVDRRLEYIKEKITELEWDDADLRSFLGNQVENWNWIQAIESLLESSRTNNDWEIITEDYLEQRKSELERQNPEAFDKLENLFAWDKFEDNKNLFFQIYFWSFQYQSMLDYYDEDDRELIAWNIQFFNEYAEYKINEQRMHPTDFPDIDLWDTDEWYWEIDYNMLENFFENFELEYSTYSDEDIENMDLELDSQERYWWSTNPAQNILYRIAKEVFGYNWPNKIYAEQDEDWDDEQYNPNASLSDFFDSNLRDSQGIYYDWDGDWKIRTHWISGFPSASLGSLDGEDFVNNLVDFLNISKWDSSALDKLRALGFWWPIGYVRETRWFEIFPWQASTWRSTQNEELVARVLEIIREEEDEIVDNKESIKGQIRDFVEEHSNGERVEIKPDLAVRWLRAWIDISQYYKHEDGKFWKLERDDDGTLQQVNVDNPNDTRDISQDTS